MIPNSYCLPDSLVCAGEYPGDLNEDGAREKIVALLGAGVRTFVDLTTEHDRMISYEGVLSEEAARLGVEARRVPMPILDMDVADAGHMNAILDLIDAEVRAGRRVYVHCWGGVGRTGTVAGCHLVRRGMDGPVALTIVRQRFSTMSPTKVAQHAGLSPQTEAQRMMVLQWAQYDRVRAARHERRIR